MQGPAAHWAELKWAVPRRRATLQRHNCTNWLVADEAHIEPWIETGRQRAQRPRLRPYTG
jgi:hypothetical protein